MYGIKHEIKLGMRFFFDYIRWMVKYHNCELKDKSFSLNFQEYAYFVHPYNHTWENERAVEIPVVYRLLQNRNESAVLEVGNVLSHYFTMHHTVLDKYEHSYFTKIINQDINSWNSTKKYELIVSISTIEHIGWDEIPKNPEKAIQAIDNIKKMLSANGKAVITFPVGYNHYLDRKLFEGNIVYNQANWLKRVTEDNQWIQITMEETYKCLYNKPFRNANGLIFLEITNN